MPQMAYSPDVVYSVYYEVNLVHIYYYVPVTRHYDRNNHMPGEVMGPQEFHLLVVGVRVVSMACICVCICVMIKTNIYIRQQEKTTWC